MVSARIRPWNSPCITTWGDCRSPNLPTNSAEGAKNRFFEAPSHLAGKRIEVRFDPLDLTQLEIYSEGRAQGVARLVDAVVNGLLPPWETEAK
ncbi:MAG: Mu transposase C-terminal domain-containing protein [Bryobacterales bacterium]|nr:Mu transposase C-terminal domain-containing protein [Bryobacterales bacterium]